MGIHHNNYVIFQNAQMGMDLHVKMNVTVGMVAHALLKAVCVHLVTLDITVTQVT